MTIEKIDLERLIAMKYGADAASPARDENAAAEESGDRATLGEELCITKTGAGAAIAQQTGYGAPAPGGTLRRPLPLAKTGRPRKLDEATKRLIPNLLSRGYTLKEAAAFVGCHYLTLRRERRRDASFDEEIHRACQVTGGELKGVLEQAASESWRAAAWVLKHQDQRIEREQKLRALEREIRELEDPPPRELEIVENPDFYGNAAALALVARRNLPRQDAPATSG